MVYTYMEDFVTDLYYRLRITEPNQLYMFVIAKKLGINIVYRKTTFRFGNDIILEKSSEQVEWQQFGHELGHRLRHVGQQLNMPYLFRQLQEYQATQFAYHFCIPTFMLDNLYDYSIYDVMNLFNVEYEFALRRLEMYKNSILLEGMSNVLHTNQNKIG
ncbi:ImmA/IrrE family metallo-endopeptidase [Virgibacillus doumboii]|uniref:ImmA/IrrE family metallo-endopeptidase n=1 Tax=Virgibacillus doumboii TaxID=2697503 RepID=UPI001FEC925F|nr:ImmA/IrrE family metallo-endopeptidase [Virgibacillus doumboii]